MFRCYHSENENDSSKRLARRRSKSINREIKEVGKKYSRPIQLLLLGSGESGKSTILKQIQIIDGKNYTEEEKKAKIPYIRKNIKDAMVAISGAMDRLGMKLEAQSNQERITRLLRFEKEVREKQFACESETAIANTPYDEIFWDDVKTLWTDRGIRECYLKSHKYQLIDSAKYFLDRIDVVRTENYIPNLQDILRCRQMTTFITDIEFNAGADNNGIKMRVIDVGGQRGERKKWIQAFDQVKSILFLFDCSCFDMRLIEDFEENRLLDALKLFNDVWYNRYLSKALIIVFLNKMDKLDEKINEGKLFTTFIQYISTETCHEDNDTCSAGGKLHPYEEIIKYFKELDFDTYQPNDTDRGLFYQSFVKMLERDCQEELDLAHSENATGYESNGFLPEYNAVSERDEQTSCYNLKRRRGSKKQQKLQRTLSSLAEELQGHEETLKTACYMKSIFERISEGEIPTETDRPLPRNIARDPPVRCHFTCAIHTNSIKIVLKDCRDHIIQENLHRFGILA